MAQKSTTLYSPEGEAYQTTDRAEITRLKARGYTDRKPRQTSGGGSQKSD